MRAQPRHTPVGLQVGDEFITPFGAIEIADVDGDEYRIHDPETGELAWLEFDVLVEITSANCWNWEAER